MGSPRRTDRPLVPRAAESARPGRAADSRSLYGRVERRPPRLAHVRDDARGDRAVFTQRYFTWTPYLYGELGPAVTDEQEQALIAVRAIQATGFYYVGERHETPASR